MIDVELWQVTPASFVEKARKLTNRVISCQFSSPQSETDVRNWVTALSPEPVAADAAVVRVIRHEPAVSDSTALSLDGLSLHTDGAFLPQPPRRFILSCSAADDGGAGASTLVPASAILSAAPEWAVEALSTASYRFLMTYDGDLSTSFVGPVLSSGPDGQPRIRWRADHIYRPEVAEARGTRAAEAAQWLQDFLESCDPFSYLLRAGELLVVPNHLMVHGRRQLSPGSRRELLRAWIF